VWSTKWSVLFLCFPALLIYKRLRLDDAFVRLLLETELVPALIERGIAAASLFNPVVEFMSWHPLTLMDTPQISLHIAW
jgi:hypothetical protein